MSAIGFGPVYTQYTVLNRSYNNLFFSVVINKEEKKKLFLVILLCRRLSNKLLFLFVQVMMEGRSNFLDERSMMWLCIRSVVLHVSGSRRMVSTFAQYCNGKLQLIYGI